MGMSEPTLLTFDELGLGFGKELEMLTNPGQSDLRFKCVLAGCLPAESLIVIPPVDTGVLPRVVEGQRIVLRVNLQCGVAIFPTTVLYVSEIPTVMVYLDFPRDVKFKQIRSAPRATINQPVLTYNKSLPNDSAIVGRLVDISPSGARLEVQEKLGEVGQTIEIKGSFAVGQLQKTIGVDAEIKTLKKQGEVISMGLLFCDIPEEKLLLLLAYAYQAISEGKVQSVY